MSVSAVQTRLWQIAATTVFCPGVADMKRIRIIIICILVTSLLFTALLLLSFNKHFYGYDVKADYQYTFESKAMLQAPTRVFHDYFILPQNVGNWDTGFLKIRLKSSLTGHILEPYLDICFDGACFRQYFELGAEGIRYVNISPLSGQHPGKVKIRAHHLSWDTQDGRLLLFRNPAISGKKILVIAPHPDDAEIAAFGLYSHKDSYIITITDGSAGPATYETFFSEADKESSYVLKAKLRVIDSLTVPLIGEVNPEKCVNLGYFDGTLEEMQNFPSKPYKAKFSNISETSLSRKYNLYQMPRSSGKATWFNLVNDLSYLLKRIQPDIIITPHPLLDSHPDHEYSSIALFEAIKQMKPAPKGALFLYTNHAFLTGYYPFGKQGSMITLPPFLSPTYKFGSVYSYELDEKSLVEKTFALDAMHALRLPPQQGTIDTTIFPEYLNNVSRISITANTFFDPGYYRRAVRSNELFFVYSFGDADRLIREFNRTHGRQVNVIK